jgi:CSLREA domain-containing protein
MKLALFIVSALLVAVALPQSSSAGAPIVVNSTADPGSGNCDEKECTLREALTVAHGQDGPDTIHFDIPGPGPHSIAPLTTLPGSIQDLTIDGTTQPGYEGQPLIELNGENLEYPANGLDFYGGSAVVRGLVVNRFPATGLYFNGTSENLVEGNYLGVDVTGTVALPNAGHGAHFVGSPNNTVAGNLVSGNNLNGLTFSDSGGNTIRGNLIGTDVSGAAAVGNGDDGIRMSGGSDSVIGGSDPGEGNVISGNGVTGVRVSGADTSLVTIYGNKIGTDASGGLPVPNQQDGIFVANDAHDNTIGGFEGALRNVIAFNGAAGVVIDGNRNAISGNLIYGNGGLGIDLLGDGVTPNDPGDLDGGPNENQNFPVIQSVGIIPGGNPLDVSGVTLTLDSLADTVFRVEVFASAACDPTGHGEGQTYLGGVTTSTDPDGHLSSNVPLKGIEDGQYLTATATAPDGNTSEFSSCFLVGGGTPLFEGWNPLVWPGQRLGTVEEVIAGLDAAIEPDVWDSVAHYSDAWYQTFREAPLPSFNTLTELQLGWDIWLFLTAEAEFLPQ